MSISIPIGYSPKSSSNSKFTSTNPHKFDFAQQLHFKLSNLAEKRQIMSKRDWPNERQATLDELDDEAEEGDISRTPERMCEWMRVQSNRPQFDGFSNAMESAPGKGGLMASSMIDHRQFWSNQEQICRDKNAESCHSNSSGFCSSESVAAGQIQSAIYSPCPVPHQLVISFRERPGAPPFVVKIPPRDLITFREFRHFFGIPLSQNKRFFFKEFCEDGSAPFQWRVIDDDSIAVPIFQGRISAECRTLSESE